MSQDPIPPCAASQSAEARKQTAAAALRGVRAMAVAAVILAVFNASALDRYISGLSGGDFVEEMRLLALDWTSITEETGLAAPRDAVRESVRAAQALSWGSGASAPAEGEADDLEGLFEQDAPEAGDEDLENLFGDPPAAGADEDLENLFDDAAQ